MPAPHTANTTDSSRSLTRRNTFSSKPTAGAYRPLPTLRPQDLQHTSDIPLRFTRAMTRRSRSTSFLVSRRVCLNSRGSRVAQQRLQNGLSCRHVKGEGIHGCIASSAPGICVKRHVFCDPVGELQGGGVQALDLCWAAQNRQQHLQIENLGIPSRIEHPYHLGPPGNSSSRK